MAYDWLKICRLQFMDSLIFLSSAPFEGHLDLNAEGQRQTKKCNLQMAARHSCTISWSVSCVL